MGYAQGRGERIIAPWEPEFLIPTFSFRQTGLTIAFRSGGVYVNSQSKAKNGNSGLDKIEAAVQKPGLTLASVAAAKIWLTAGIASLSFAPASSFIDPTPGRSESFASSMRHATGSALAP